MSELSEKIYEIVYSGFCDVANGAANLTDTYKKLNKIFNYKYYIQKGTKGYSQYTELYTELLKSHYDIAEEAKQISRIMVEIDGINEAGFPLDMESISTIRLYEIATKSKVNIAELTTEQFQVINKCLTYTKAISRACDVATFISLGSVLYECKTMIAEGRIDDAGKHLRDWGCTTITGYIGTTIGMWLVTGFALSNPLLSISIIAVCGMFGVSFGDSFSDLLDDIFNLYDEAGAYIYPVDPLIFDLNGDGVKTVALADGVHFDYDKNGFAEKMGWVSAEDGLLVRDLDHNGKIDSGRELMGDLAELSEDMVASNGFEALAYFDENADGVIDEKDAIYSELQIWQDKNQNGTVEDGELMSLSEAGIASINLAYENIDVTDDSGNRHLQRISYTRTDGTTLFAEDIWFEQDVSNTVTQVMLDETEEIAGLPDIQGKGNQYSLHQAMLRDNTGRLKQLVQEYIAETDSSVRKSLLPEMIYVWTGVNDIEPTSRGDAISDARRLAALEVIAGRAFNSAYGPDPVQQAGEYLEEAFDKLIDVYYGQLEMQTTYAEEYAELYRNIDLDDDGNIVYDLTSIAQRYTKEYEQDLSTGRKHIFDFVDNLRKTGMDFVIGKEKVYQAFSVIESDLYHAIDYQGDDVISGTNEDDVLIGEAGNDELYGGDGDDIYVFHLGDGQDVIEDWGGMDTIRFGEGIAEEDILVSRDRWDLYLTNKKSGDQIAVADFFYREGKMVEQVEFADGTKWDLDDLKDRARYYYGTDGDDEIGAWDSNYYAPSLEDDYMYGGAGNDSLSGNSGDDYLYGGEGDDMLDGGNGDDVLVGGTGNDELYGRDGDDIYVFHLGDGQDVIEDWGGMDTIRFGEGIAEEDILVSRDMWNLYLTNWKSGDQITITDFFYRESKMVEQVEFADGTKWDLDDLKDRARYYYGTGGDDEIGAWDSNYYAPSLEDDYMYGGAGNDSLSGNSGDDYLYGGEGDDMLDGGNGDDVLVGGTGNDELYGGDGDDIYVFHLGDGQDVIEDWGGMDTIRFGEGIAEEDILVSRDRWNLYLTNWKSGDQITITDFFYRESKMVEQVEFADGTKWELGDLKEKEYVVGDFFATRGVLEVCRAHGYITYLIDNVHYHLEAESTYDSYEMDRRKMDLIIQTMASFEDISGMTWQDAVEQKDERAAELLNQWWTKKAV